MTALTTSAAERAFSNGGRYATVQIFGFAVERMRQARFTDAEILAAVEETLKTGLPPEGQVASEARELEGVGVENA
jgi:hypothetical protein